MSQYQPGQPWGVQPPEPVRVPDIRPLYKRKRVWAGGIALLVAGSVIGGGGSSSASAGAPRPKVTVTATATATKTPAPAPTVTVTAKPKPRPTVTVTRTAQPASGNSAAKSTTSGGGSSSGGSSSGGSSTGGSSASGGGTSHPAGATAQCNDGTYSYAAHHQGACSHHGGVAVFYR
ncbi:DUF3761 domain-containing protein [Streptomyces sp. NPDC004682]